MSKLTEKIWTCKIGGLTSEDLADGSDLPMRQAVQAAFREITGQHPDFTFSGWGGELDEIERMVISRRAPASARRAV